MTVAAAVIRARPTYGVVPLTKPVGMTSFQAVREVRRLLGERRVGHAGTLDPTATGLLPICIGQATRFVDYFHLQQKRYRCGIRLGETSPTLDTEGTITPGADAGGLDEGAVRAALASFVGDIQQLPPMHSAVRREGRHLYEIAREGGEVERSPRPVTIYAAELVRFTPGLVAEAEITVSCGKGTYMRVLAADLGAQLGCGGMLGWLERTGYGPFGIDDAISLDAMAALDDPWMALWPVDTAVCILPRVDLGPQLISQLQRGQSAWIPRTPGPGPQGTCRVHDAEGRFVAIGELQANLLRPTKVVASAHGNAVRP